MSSGSLDKHKESTYDEYDSSDSSDDVYDIYDCHAENNLDAPISCDWS